jgi:hypothetical protein
MRTVFRVLFAVVTLVMVPASLWAQGAITGVVKDASGCRSRRHGRGRQSGPD